MPSVPTRLLLFHNISHQGIVTTQPSPDLGNLVPPPQVPSVVAAPTPSSTPGPSMVICGRSAAGTSLYLMLCGDHFTPGDKVTVVLEYLKNSKSLAPVTVNAKGQFEASV